MSEGREQRERGEEPVDIQKHRLIREMREEFAGLFGITDDDIERAVTRLMEGKVGPSRGSGEALPPLLREAIRHLDSLEAIVSRAVLEENHEVAEKVLELSRYYIDKFQSVIES